MEAAILEPIDTLPGFPSYRTFIRGDIIKKLAWVMVTIMIYIKIERLYAR